MRKKFIAAIALAAVAAFGLSMPAQAQAASSGYAQVSILHAVPNTPVDVYVNHHRLLQNFQPGSLNGPFTFASGTAVVTITAANSANDKSPVIGPVDVKFNSGRNYTLVAHLDASGAPTAKLYSNNLDKAKKGTGRVTVRHDAAAPPVDILAGDAVVIANLVNPNQKSREVAPGTLNVKVNLAGTSTTAIGPAPVTVKAGYTTFVYAWGSAADNNLSVAVQYLKLNK